MTLKKGFLNQVNLLLHYEIQLWNKLELSAVFFNPFKTRPYIEIRNRISTVCYRETDGVNNLLSLSQLSYP